MRSTNGTSINTSRLAYTWKVEMERGDRIKGGDYEMRDDKIKGKTL